MPVDAYCPDCRAFHPHKVAMDQRGRVLWCEVCFRVHVPSADTPGNDCPYCRYWSGNACVHVSLGLEVRPEDGWCPWWAAATVP